MNRRTFSLAAASMASIRSTWGRSDQQPFSSVGVCAALPMAGAIQTVGGEFIEENVQRLLMPDQPESEWLKTLEIAKACPLPIPVCNSFLPGNLKCIGPNADAGKVLRYAETAFRRAQQVDVGIIVFGSGASRRVPDGFTQEKAADQFAELLGEMGAIAQRYGVAIVIEPLRRHETNFINTIREGAALVEKVGHPHVRLLFDTYHMLQNGEDPNDLRQAGALLIHGHIAEKELRTPPGVAGDDFSPFFAALKHIGYKGRISIEGKLKIEQLPKAFEVIRSHALTA